MPHGGGRPALADPFGSFLHPMSMLFSLLFGAVAGASYTLSFAFLLLGASALWLGQMLGLHLLVRGWFALAVMIGGHVICRLELGSIGMPLSLASLFAAYVVVYWSRGHRRNCVQLQLVSHWVHFVCLVNCTISIFLCSAWQ